MNKWLNKFFLNLLAYSVSFIIILLFLEIALRFLPVSNAIRTKPLNNNSNPFDASAEKFSSYDYSTNWFFNNPQTRKTNNLGFFSDFNYYDGFDGIVIIGDSQVESLQVPFEETFHQLLSLKLNKRIYNFGLSGAPLSQYQAYAQEVCKRYSPKKIYFLIIENDFIHSWKEHRIRDGWFHYNENNDLKPTEYKISLIRYIANKSSLIQYFYFNLSGGVYLIPFMRPANSNINKYSRFDLEKKAISIFFKSLNSISCISPNNTLFILDGNRLHLDEDNKTVYSGGEKNIKSFQYFNKIAKKYNYEVLDLHEHIKKDYEKNLIKYDTIYDSHWSAYGHKKVSSFIFNFLKN